MSMAQTRRPLLYWDRCNIRFDLDSLQQVFNQQLDARGSAVRELRFESDGDGVTIRGVVAFKGLPTRLAVRIEELRLYRRFFGCRVTELRGPLGVPLPRGLLQRLIEAIDSSRIGFDTEDAIFTFDLRESLPPGLDVAVRDVNCLGRELIVTLDHGSWRPTVRDVLLPPDAGPDADGW